MSRTSLQMKQETHERLLAHKKENDTFDTLITRLLDRWEAFYGLS